MKTRVFLCVCCTIILTTAACRKIAAAEPTSTVPAPRFGHGRTDNELMATYGTCRQTDIRHFARLTAAAWDTLNWQSAGDYCGFEYDGIGRGVWPQYQARLEILVDGRPQAVQPRRIAQQFDCRVTEGEADGLEFRRIDMMIASLQWVTAWQCRNTSGRPVEIEYRLSLRDDRRLPKTLAVAEQDYVIVADKYLAHLMVSDRKPTATVAGAQLVLRWKAQVAAGGELPVCLAVRPSWAEAWEDRQRPLRGDVGYRYKATQHGSAGLPKCRELEFQAATRLLGLPDAGLNWPDVVKMSQVKQQRLYEPMPVLAGLPPAWEGVWAYTFDLLRVGTKPPQGFLDGTWMIGDPVFYVWACYWDTASAAQAYCHYDAGTAARTILTFLRGGVEPDGRSRIMLSPFCAWHEGPQLPNIAMALWDCYQANRDRTVIARAYPILARHQDWLDRVWNQRPGGPVADIGFNIDYGCALHEQRHIWVDMNMFQVNQYEMLAKMAGLLGKGDAAVKEWQAKAARLRAGINRLMWNPADGAYYSLKSADLTQTRVTCPIEFYAMTTGVADRGQARRLVARLMDPAKYAPGKQYRFFCPSVAFDDPSFRIVDGWGGTIWPVEPYYTVRGLAAYGFQDEAAAVSKNLFGMAADEYVRTGSIWEQYRPDTGRGLHLKYFTSGIGSTIVDMLLRGALGFERTDRPLAFYLTPRPLTDGWHGIDNLRLAGPVRLGIRLKDQGQTVACRLRVVGWDEAQRSPTNTTGLPLVGLRSRLGAIGDGIPTGRDLVPPYTVRIEAHDLRTGARRQLALLRSDGQGEVTAELAKTNETRYLWELAAGPLPPAGVPHQTSSGKMTQQQASAFARLALKAIEQEYPNKPDHVLNGQGDVRSPRAMHPAFYGAFDWHSSVHGHWMLVHLLRLFPALPERQQIRAALAKHLTAANLRAEADYFAQPNHQSFERTYGWAWLLKLAEELHGWNDADGRGWSQNLRPLCDAVVAGYLSYLPKQTYPIRIGIHANTALGMAFAWDYAQAVGHDRLRKLIEERSRRYFAADADAPAGWEPGGVDFLSPVLVEADLMRRVMGPAEFAAWLGRFLPQLARGEPKILLDPVAVTDRRDPHLVHLDGLNLSRAWCMRSIAAALPPDDPRRKILADASARHADAGLRHVASGDYAGEHWLASFAVYLLSTPEVGKTADHR